MSRAGDARLFPERETADVGEAMKDMQEHLDKLQVQIVECEMIRDEATDPKKRELFAKLAENYKVLAAEIRRAMMSVVPNPGRDA